MPNINTTYSLSDTLSANNDLPRPVLLDSVCPLNQEDTAAILICPPVKQKFPGTAIKANENLLGCLLFTICFLIIFAFIRLRGKDLLFTLLSIVIKRKKTEIVLNEGISSNLVCYVLGLFLSFSVIAVSIIYLAESDFILLHILYVFGILIAYHFFLLGLFQLLGWTFNARYAASEAIINLWTYHIMGGLLIAPFVIATFFVKVFAIAPLLNIVMISLVLFQIVKFIRWIQILFAHRVLILYMILYLCALEVMPLLVLFKIAA